MKYVVKPSVTLFITAVIVTAMLSLSYALTLGPIEQQVVRTQEAAMKEALPQAESFREIETEKTGSIVKVFEGSNAGQSVGYVVELMPEGYGGSIDMVVGISSVSETITGVRVLKHSETPGLGAQAVKEDFYRRYDNRKLSPLTVVRVSSAENEVDAMTSATITTKAVTGAVNEAIEWYNGGGGR